MSRVLSIGLSGKSEWLVVSGKSEELGLVVRVSG